MVRLPDTSREDVVEPVAAAITWALTVQPPGAAEYGLLVYLAPRVGQDFAVEISLTGIAKKLGSTTNTLSRALRKLTEADLVVVEELEKVDGVYQAGRGKRVRLNHPCAPHMSPAQVAERAEVRERRAALRASIPDEVWQGLKATRRHSEDEDSSPAAPMVARLERGGLRLLTSAAVDAQTTTPEDTQRRAAR